jgi:hypothetical protein
MPAAHLRAAMMVMLPPVRVPVVHFEVVLVVLMVPVVPPLLLRMPIVDY